MQLNPDAVLWSAPEAQRAGRPVLVLLHGHGSHEGDLFGLSPALPLTPVIASVRAPIPEGAGFTWFSRSDSPVGDPPADRADAAAAALVDWVDTLGDVPVGLLGFSQGAAVTLQVMRHRPERFDYGVALSGFLVAGGHPGDAALAARRPPVFWAHGDADEVVPEASVERTTDWLPEHTDLEAHRYPGLGHNISTPELDDIVQFLRARY